MYQRKRPPVQIPFPNKHAISAPNPGSQASRLPNRIGSKARNPFTTQLNWLADSLRQVRATPPYHPSVQPHNRAAAFMPVQQASRLAKLTSATPQLCYHPTRQHRHEPNPANPTQHYNINNKPSSDVILIFAVVTLHH